jgi:hypothetical protein
MEDLLYIDEFLEKLRKIEKRRNWTTLGVVACTAILFGYYLLLIKDTLVYSLHLRSLPGAQVFQLFFLGMFCIGVGFRFVYRPAVFNVILGLGIILVFLSFFIAAQLL